MARTLAIGDIHGCANALQTLIDAVVVSEDDTLVTLGDYVNRGPDTKGVLDWLIEHDRKWNLIPLRGNHEIMTLRARNDQESFDRWLRCGGRATLLSYGIDLFELSSMSDIPLSHWNFLEHRLVPFYETQHHFFVHANAHPHLPLSEQPDYMLYWERFNDPPRHQSGKIMVCGHTSQKSGLPRFNANAICIDTWAWAGGWLTCLDVDRAHLWQANEAGQVREISLDELRAASI